MGKERKIIGNLNSEETGFKDEPIFAGEDPIEDRKKKNEAEAAEEEKGREIRSNHRSEIGGRSIHVKRSKSQKVTNIKSHKRKDVNKPTRKFPCFSMKKLLSFTEENFMELTKYLKEHEDFQAPEGKNDTKILNILMAGGRKVTYDDIVPKDKINKTSYVARVWKALGDEEGLCLLTKAGTKPVVFTKSHFFSRLTVGQYYMLVQQFGSKDLVLPEGAIQNMKDYLSSLRGRVQESKTPDKHPAPTPEHLQQFSIPERIIVDVNVNVNLNFKGLLDGLSKLFKQ